MNKIGHVAYERQGSDLYLHCNHCGSCETVVDYETGGRPRHFCWSGLKPGEEEFAKCLHCLMAVRPLGRTRD